MPLLVTGGLGSTVAAAPPAVTGISPAPGTAILPTTQLVFDVTVAGGVPFTVLILTADMPSLSIREVVHDGFGFGPAYRGPVNQRTAVTNGFRFTLMRDGGWPSSPTLTPYAVAGGLENT